ncbi:MAG: DUF2147 domain-containing protein [Gammaproteobacteria bacterium]
MKRLIYISLIILGQLTMSAARAVTEADILGVWVNQAGDGLIEITKTQNLYRGAIVGSTDGKDRLDVNNPDPTLKTRSLLNVVVLGDFTYQHPNYWLDGWIYDPNNGKKYNCKMKLTDSNTLEIRGYIGFSLFGRTEIWKKQKI